MNSKAAAELVSKRLRRRWEKLTELERQVLHAVVDGKGLKSFSGTPPLRRPPQPSTHPVQLVQSTWGFEPVFPRMD